MRDLTAQECDLVEFEAPLTIARREFRFFVGPWRPSKWYVITHRRHGPVMACTRRELAARGITP